jgi:hypothetical protein
MASRILFIGVDHVLIQLRAIGFVRMRRWKVAHRAPLLKYLLSLLVVGTAAVRSRLAMDGRRPGSANSKTRAK